MNSRANLNKFENPFRKWLVRVIEIEHLFDIFVGETSEMNVIKQTFRCKLKAQLISIHD